MVCNCKTFSFKLIFESEFQDSADGVVALDDVEVSYSPCEENESTVDDGSAEEFYKSRRKCESFDDLLPFRNLRGALIPILAKGDTTTPVAERATLVT